VLPDNGWLQLEQNATGFSILVVVLHNVGTWLVFSKTFLAKDWQKVGKKLAKGWQKIGKRLAKNWQKVGKRLAKFVIL
jgi:hypothetical protein